MDIFLTKLMLFKLTSLYMEVSFNFKDEILHLPSHKKWLANMGPLILMNIHHKVNYFS
jgi:hypothetical protein